ncbi:MAG: 5-epimerase [Actinomycetota bacterium]|nr:5-epimerase [Actinomycetota bacterium]
MQVKELAVEGAFAFTPTVYPDDRGVFVSPFQEPAFVEATGHRHSVAQTNLNVSARDVIRGIHFTRTPPGQSKYVYCVRGRALDVVVDLRLGSPTFGRFDAVELDDRGFAAMYFPVGVGHTFLALEDRTTMSYVVTSFYNAANELSVNPLDPELGLPWPKDRRFRLSDRDTAAPTLAEARDLGLLPAYADCVPARPAAAR